LKKKFVLNLILLVVLNLLVKPFWIFGIDRTVQNRVGTTEYGMYFSLFSLSVLLNILLDAGLTNFNNRAISRNKNKLQVYLPNLLGVKLILAFVYLLVCLALGLMLQYNQRQLSLLFILCLNQFLNSLILFLRSSISGLQYYTTDSLLSVLDRLLVIIFCGLLLWTNLTGGTFRIEWFAWIQTLSYGLTALTVFLILQHKARRLTWHIHLSSFIRILRYSLPYATLVFLMACYSRIDSVMIERMLPDGKYQAGIYAQAFRILDAAAMAGYLFAGLLLPMFSSLLKKKEDVSSLLYLAFSLIIIPAITASLVTLLYKNPLMFLLYHHTEAAPVLGILMMAFPGFATTYIFGTLLTAAGRLKELNLMAASVLLTNVILNLWLIPRHGALGAAISSAFSQLCAAIIQVFMAFSLLPVIFKKNYFLKLLMLTGLLIVVSLLLAKMPLSWGKGTLLLSSFAFILAVLFNLISLAGIRKTSTAL